MADIIKVFGENASIDASTPTSPILSVHWSDLKSSLTSSSSSPGTTAEDWLAAILYYSLDTLSPLSQSERKCAVLALSTSLAVYNNSRQRAYGLQVNFYEPDDGASRPSAISL